MKKMYKTPAADLFVLAQDVLLASGDSGNLGGDGEDDGFSGALPGWNGEEIVLPPMPLPSH